MQGINSCVPKRQRWLLVRKNLEASGTQMNTEHHALQLDCRGTRMVWKGLHSSYFFIYLLSHDEHLLMGWTEQDIVHYLGIVERVPNYFSFKIVNSCKWFWKRQSFPKIYWGVRDGTFRVEEKAHLIKVFCIASPRMYMWALVVKTCLSSP